MRRLYISLVVAVATALVPLWALAGNQDVAEQIAAGLRESGQLHGYKIGVKFQDGTAWLRGTVSSREQMNTAMKVVYQTPGVTQVVNNLTVAGETETPAAPQTTGSQLQQAAGAMAPDQSYRSVVPALPPASARADRVATSFAPAAAQPTAVEEPALVDPSDAPLPHVAAPAPASTQLASIEHSVTTQPRPMAAKSPTARPMTPMPVAMLQNGVPTPMAPVPSVAPAPAVGVPGAPIPQYVAPPAMGAPVARYDQPNMPNYAWPSYAAYPNYAALTYPKQYSPTAWPYIGPFYPYPQVPLGWRKTTLQWHDGWWWLDFDDGTHKGPISGLFRPR